MVNVRQRLYRNGTVDLLVTGPKRLFGRVGRRFVTARLTDTWLQVLNEQCKLEINGSDGYYVRRTYVQEGVTSRDGNGWECGLDEQVSVFVNKFRRSCKRHCAVVCVRDRSSDMIGPSTLAQVPSLIPIVEGVGMDNGGDVSDFLEMRMFEGASTSMAVGREEEGEGDERREDLGWGRGDGDLESLATGVGRQWSVLNEKGISVEEVKAKVVQQVNNCSKKLILGVIADVLKQQGKPSWEGMVQKMPSVCHFLDKIVNKSN